MKNSSSDESPRRIPDHLKLNRLPTGIPGLDTVLRGGVLQGGLYIVQGVPGAGKTILANEICYNHVAARGGRALYVTLLAETHTRMMQHLGPMRFFDPTRVEHAITYINGFSVLRSEGLPGLLALLRRELEARAATLLVLDGFVAAQQQAPSETDFKTFVHGLQVLMTMTDCTGFLLSTGGVGQPVAPEHTMVDGLLDLDNGQFEFRAERGLTVRKLRGTGFLQGRHPFEITDDGIVVYPRIEALYRRPSRPDEAPRTKLSTGVDALDAMLGGGLTEATMTALVGPTGSCKTSLGLQFLGKSSAEEPGLLFGFFETPVRLYAKAASMGTDLKGLAERGYVEILWQAPTEQIMDALAHKLLDAVDRLGVKRLFVDGLGGFIEAAIQPGRISRFFAAMAYELRARGVTTLYTMEVQQVIAPAIQMPISGISSMVENLIVTRHVEQGRRLHRLLSIVKVRDSDFDPMFREIVFADGRLSLADSFSDAEDLLSGFAHGGSRQNRRDNATFADPPTGRRPRPTTPRRK
jgi:circadian clock protein KaiC